MRRQEVTRCWREEAGAWHLRDIAFVDDWSEADYAQLLDCLRETLSGGGAVWGAFAAGRLVGLASLGQHRTSRLTAGARLFARRRRQKYAR